MHHNKLTQLYRLIFLSTVALALTHCADDPKAEYRKLIEKPAENISYYPYLAEDQYAFMHRQNTVGIIPGAIIIPAHKPGALEYQMNASSWWGSWPNEVTFINYFLAEQAKRKLGCGPLKEGAKFTLPAGIYTYKQQKISIASSISWFLSTNVTTMCWTKSYLPDTYYKHDSIYWITPYSQNRISP